MTMPFDSTYQPKCKKPAFNKAVNSFHKADI